MTSTLRKNFIKPIYHIPDFLRALALGQSVPKCLLGSTFTPRDHGQRSNIVSPNTNCPMEQMSDDVRKLRTHRMANLIGRALGHAQVVHDCSEELAFTAHALEQEAGELLQHYEALLTPPEPETV